MKPSQYRATLDLLAKRFPHCFFLFDGTRGRRRPLKVGIHIDLLRDLNGTITEKRLCRFLAWYTRHRRYLNNVLPGVERIDLTGKVVGRVTAEDAAHARELARKRLAGMKAARAAAKAVPGPRLSLADLKAAALARKAVP